jgi:hypothetical protein
MLAFLLPFDDHLSHNDLSELKSDIISSMLLSSTNAVLSMGFTDTEPRERLKGFKKSEETSSSQLGCRKDVYW